MATPLTQREELTVELCRLLNTSDVLDPGSAFVSGEDKTRIYFKFNGVTYRLLTARHNEGSAYDRQKEKNRRIWQATKELRSHHEVEYQTRYKQAKKYMSAQRAAKEAYKAIKGLYAEEWDVVLSSWLNKPYTADQRKPVVNTRGKAFKILRSRYEEEFYTKYEYLKARYPSVQTRHNYTTARNELIAAHKDEFAAIRRQINPNHSSE